ncbi:uncharacterized protein METZ01_LOCUS492389 [marine metagenome]|uniref:Uncharacterized protein n=1 Tax=marine metagenome TaxID=408172 RepID=A0A383D5J7_9ZZZZ
MASTRTASLPLSATFSAQDPTGSANPKHCDATPVPESALNHSETGPVAYPVPTPPCGLPCAHYPESLPPFMA